MIVVTHEIVFAAKVAGRIMFMEDDQLLVDDKPEKAFESPEPPRLKKFLSSVF